MNNSKLETDGDVSDVDQEISHSADEYDSDIEQGTPNSIDAAHAREVCRPKQELEMWVSDIENRLARQFPYLSQPPEVVVVDDTRKYPSIYPSDHLPKKFELGIHLYGCNRKDPMWEYVAFMSRWLGFKIDLYIKNIQEKENIARGYYEETDARRLVCDSNNFLEYLMVSSCFLCFAIILFQKETHDDGINILKGTDYSFDPDSRSKQFKILYREIMNSPTQTKLDMLNLGNQIPWFAVQAVFTNSDLHKLVVGDPIIRKERTTDYRLAISCFGDLYPRENKSKFKAPIPLDGFKHLLHIFHWTRTPGPLSWQAERSTDQRLPFERFGMFHIPSATELLESATAIKKLTSGFCHVEYESTKISAVMQIAPLHVFPYSDEVFSDLLEFEQRYLECGLPVTAHIACMKGLLQTKEDVKLLQQNGIVQSTLKDRKDVLDFVHHLSKNLSDQNAFLPRNLLTDIRDKVNSHHEHRLGRDFAEFKSHFCPNRWVVISVIAAVILFVLTFIQTIYTTFGYYKT